MGDIMKIGIGPYYYKSYGGVTGAERMRRHGYDYLDFDLYANIYGELYDGDGAEFVRNTEALRDKLANEGYSLGQIHGPWVFPVPNATEAERELWFEKCVRACHAAQILGVKYMAIHPLMPYPVDKPHTKEQAEDVWRINIDFFTRLAAYGEKHGVYICLENMPFPDFPISSSVDIMRVVKTVNHPYFRVCLDTGHANVVKPSPSESVRIIGKEYLKILHVHGNDGKGDYHYNPFDARDTVDWAAFTCALKEIGFDGVVSLETAPCPDNHPDLTPEEVETGLASIAKKIAGIK